MSDYNTIIMWGYRIEDVSDEDASFLIGEKCYLDRENPEGGYQAFIVFEKLWEGSSDQIDYQFWPMSFNIIRNMNIFEQAITKKYPSLRLERGKLIVHSQKKSRTKLSSSRAST